MNALASCGQAAGFRFAPYAREVMEALAGGKQPNVRLYACRPDPWTPARKHRETFGPGTAIVFPVDASPESIRWPPIGELVANITGLPGDTVHALAHALVRDGIRLAWLLDEDDSKRALRVVRKQEVA